MSSRSLILFAHGARDPNWALPFKAIAREITTGSESLDVRLAFLEFMDPDLPTAAAEAVALGAREVDVVPLFLGAGGHVRKDLPGLMEALGRQHPLTSFTLHPAIGELPTVVSAMAQAALALVGRPQHSPADSVKPSKT